MREQDFICIGRIEYIHGESREKGKILEKQRYGESCGGHEYLENFEERDAE